jgi:thiol-disulfide isomerase/thioredoxin
MHHYDMLKALCVIMILGPAVILTATPAHASDVVFDDPVRRAVGDLTPLSGTPVADFAGKITVVSFFASWCPPCTDEFRQLNKLRAAFPEKHVTIVALNLFEGYSADPGGTRMSRFLAGTKPTFPVLGGMADGTLAAWFGGIERIPTVYVFDAAGRLAFQFIHEKDATKRHAGFDELAVAIRPLVGS